MSNSDDAALEGRVFCDGSHSEKAYRPPPRLAMPQAGRCIISVRKHIESINNVAGIMNAERELPGVDPSAEPVGYMVAGDAYAPEDLPLRGGPLRFALMNSDGISSESWKVEVTSRGEVYIVCREANLDIKVSLHESGHQKIAYHAIWRDVPVVCDQRWEEHQHYRGDRARPSFTLMFPGFGLFLDEKWRRDHSHIWSARHVLVRAPYRPLATLVGFVIVDEDVSVMDRVGYAVLAEIPTRPGKKLCVIAGYTSEHNMSNRLRNGLKRILVESSLEDFIASFNEPFRVFGLSFPEEGGPWLLCLPVQLDWDDILGAGH